MHLPLWIESFRIMCSCSASDINERTHAHPRTIIQSGPRNVACIIQAPTLTLPQPHSVRNLCIKIPVNEPTICLQVNKRRTSPSLHTPFPRDPLPPQSTLAALSQSQGSINFSIRIASPLRPRRKHFAKWLLKRFTSLLESSAIIRCFNLPIQMSLT